MADIEEGEICDSPENRDETQAPEKQFHFSEHMKSDKSVSYRPRTRTLSSSDENSDVEEDTPLWRQKQEKYFRKRKDIAMDMSSSPVKKGPSMNGHSLQQSKKRNNIWGSVLTEQDLTQTLVKSAAVDNSSALPYNERNVESYDFTKKYIDNRSNLDDPDKTELDFKHDPFEAVLSSVSKGTVAKGREIIDYEDAVSKPKSDIDLRRSLNRSNRKRRADSSSDRQERSKIHERLGAKKVTTIPVGELDVSEDMEVSELSQKIANILHEAKVELIERVVQHLGKEVAIRILQLTKETEESGGMYTLDGSRRRTPGGVYLTLLKQQPEYNGEIKKLIFVEDVAEISKFRKERKKKAKELRKKRRKAEKKNDGNQRSRSNSSSRSRSPPKKIIEDEDKMDEDEEKEITEDIKVGKGSSQRQSRKNEPSDSESSDEHDERQISNKCKPFNFEDELAAAKKMILEKQKSIIEKEEMKDCAELKKDVADMDDLDEAEANVVDVEIG